jgi:hypothetical protein
MAALQVADVLERLLEVANIRSYILWRDDGLVSKRSLSESAVSQAFSILGTLKAGQITSISLATRLCFVSLFLLFFYPVS